ncbi:MAG: PQQ-binding-like beta-propeller repeat protein, partial [Thermodesulfobacteriota bacterium]
MSELFRKIVIVWILLMFITVPAVSYAAHGGVHFTITSAPPTPTPSTTMQTQSTLNFIITNTGTPGVDDPISEVKFRFPNNGCSNPNTTYYTANSATAPAGWSVRKIKTECVKDKTEISFRESSQVCGNGLAPGASLTFGVEVTPYMGSADRSDDLVRAEAKDKWDCGNGDKSRFDTSPIAPWDVKGLKVSLSAVPVSLGVGDTITLTATVTNMTDAVQNNILPGTITVTTPDTGAAVPASGPTPAFLDLASGVSDTFTWTYTASNTGTVVFDTASVGNGTASSDTASSNTVTIGDLTASLNLSPSQVITGQDVTVRMIVQNNGSTAATNVTPSTLTSLGTATTVCTGPTPGTIGNLQPGQAGSFTWTCTISGIVGDTYSFSNYATSGAVQTNTAISNEGAISAYAVVVSPSSVVSGTVSPASPITLQFTVYNNGGFPVERVKITQPDAAFTSTDTQNINNCPTDWEYRYKNGPPEKYEFRACNGTEIPDGGNRTFSLTFDGVPVVTVDTTYTFPVEIRDTNGGRNTVGVEFTVAAAVIVSDAVNPAITSGNTQSTIYWSPPGTDYDGILVLRSPDATFTTPTDGVDYTTQVGQVIGVNDTVVYFDSDMTYVNIHTDTGLTNDTIYYYKVFNHNEYFIYSVGTALDATPRDPADDRQWAYSVGFTTLVIPALDIGALYSGSNGNNIFSMSTTDGSEIWRAKETAAPVQSGIQIVPISPGGSTSYLLASSQDGRVYAIDTATGANVWTSPQLGDSVQAAPAVQLLDNSPSFQGIYTTDVVFAATRNLSATNNKLYALDATDGTILWTFNDVGAYQIDIINA